MLNRLRAGSNLARRLSGAVRHRGRSRRHDPRLLLRHLRPGLLLRPRPENLSRLAQALSPYHPRLRGAPEGLPFRFDEDTLRGGLNFTLATDIGDIDLMGEVAGVGDYAAALAASERVELFGATFDVLTLDALIASKRAAGRPKDLLVLPELEALREATEE